MAGATTLKIIFRCSHKDFNLRFMILQVQFGFLNRFYKATNLPNTPNLLLCKICRKTDIMVDDMMTSWQARMYEKFFVLNLLILGCLARPTLPSPCSPSTCLPLPCLPLPHSPLPLSHLPASLALASPLPHLFPTLARRVTTTHHHHPNILQSTIQLSGSENYFTK